MRIIFSVTGLFPSFMLTTVCLHRSCSRCDAFRCSSWFCLSVNWRVPGLFLIRVISRTLDILSPNHQGSQNKIINMYITLNLSLLLVVDKVILVVVLVVFLFIYSIWYLDFIYSPVQLYFTFFNLSTMTVLMRK